MSDKAVTYRTNGEAALEPPRVHAYKSDAARARETEGVVCQTHVGGQALIEGIMMRGKFNWAVAVREPSGSIYIEEHDLVSGRDKNSWMYKPVIRGCTSLVESLALGFKALEIAAEHAMGLEDDGSDENLVPAVAEGKPTPVAPSAGVVPEPRRAPGDPLAPYYIRPLDESFDPEVIEAQVVEVVDVAESAESVDSSDSAVPASAAKPADADASADVTSSTDAAMPVDAASPVNPTNPASPVKPVSSAKPADADKSAAIPKPVMTASMIIGVLLGIGIFIVLPAFITNLLVGDYGEKTLLWNIVDGILRVAIFVAYIWLIGRMEDIRRMFGYHGAEHKTIHCYEHGLELTVENARQFPTLHVRCGTAFMLTTMLIAILVFTIVPVGPLIDALGVTSPVIRFLLVVASRIILLPLIAGLSYEVTVKWAGSHPDHTLVQIVLWPGLMMQKLTTHEPDDSMLECAIAAMKRVLMREDLESALSSMDDLCLEDQGSHG
ncbi:MAG: DUF1385 domain-containing protein [Coriobacteriales bacterium]|jgi:uncharacterized protein YqhQ|nr:DUF1385 domain-containing protein [Coriobacteriales bacterium]